MPSFGETTGNVLRYMLGGDLVSDIDAGFQALAEDVASKALFYVQDTLAKRPAAGVPNRFFKDTDDGLLWHDTGSVFEPILGPGLGAASYSAQTEVASNTEVEPSSTRPAFVAMTIRVKSSGTSVWEVFVGGQRIAEYSGREGAAPMLEAFSFFVPPGKKFKVVYNSSDEKARFSTLIL